MAFITQQEEENNNQEGGVGVGGSGGLIGSGGGTLNASTPTNAQTGTGFSNLTAYLDANKAQTGDMAQDVIGQLGQDQTAFQNTVNQAQTGFQDMISQNNPTNINPLWVNSPTYDRAGDEDFMALANAEFRGPNDFTQTQDYQGLMSALGDYQDRANLLGSESGRSSLLTEMAGPGATRGGNALDQFLLQNDAGARDALGTFQQQAQDDTSIADAVTGTNQFVTDTQTALDDASSDLAALLDQMGGGPGKTVGGTTGYGMIDPMGTNADDDKNVGMPDGFGIYQ